MKKYLVVCALACSLIGGRDGLGCDFSAFLGTTSLGTSPSPFGMVFSLDQCYLLVGVTRADGVAAIDVFVNNGTTFLLSHTVPFKGGTAGRLILDPTGTFVLLAGGLWVGRAPLMAVILGTISPLYWDDPVPMPGVLNLIVRASTGRVFVTEERNNALVILREDLSFLGRIPVDIAPVGLAWNTEETVLYVTSQRANTSRAWANTCHAEAGGDPLPGMPPPTPIYPYGVLTAIAVPALTTTSVAAGCAPVRVISRSPYIYVTARGSDQVQVFTPALVLQQSIATGRAPVGEAFKIGPPLYYIQTDSERFTVPLPNSYARVYTVLNGLLSFAFAVPEWKFPREVTSSPDGTVIAITNAESAIVQINKF